MQRVSCLYITVTTTSAVCHCRLLPLYKHYFGHYYIGGETATREALRDFGEERRKTKEEEYGCCQTTKTLFYLTSHAFGGGAFIGLDS